MARQVVLQSWKEISKYVGRTERTLQRWEREFGFPVHRPSGKSRSAVMALTQEIREWTRGRPSLLQIRRTTKLNRTKLMAPMIGEHNFGSPQIPSSVAHSAPALASAGDQRDAGYESMRRYSSLLQTQRILLESVAMTHQEQKILLSKLRRNLNAATAR